MKIEEILINLVKFKTMTSNHKEAKLCFDYIKSLCKSNNLNISDFVHNDYPSLLISNCTSMDFDILFNGHIDVVFATDDLFDPKIQDGFLIGRGAIDMKGAVAAMIETVLEYHGDKKVGLLLTSDEEIGGFNGVGAYLKTNKITSKLVIVPDGGTNYDITIAERGVLQLELTVLGKNAHSSLLNEGENAISKAYNIYSQTVEKFCKNSNPPIDDNLSINLAFLHSGEIYNQVPCTATMGLDIRYFELDTEKLLQFLREIDPSIKIKIYASASSFSVDVNNPYFKVFLTEVERLLGKQKFVKTNGASDARFFGEIGLPVAIMNPVGDNFHANDEKVSIESLYKLKDLYLSLIKNI